MELPALLMFLAILALFGIGLIPKRIANRLYSQLRSWVPNIAMLACLFAIASACTYFLLSPMPAGQSLELPVFAIGTLSIYFDGSTAVMMVLVSSVGWIVSRFSVRYLDGEDAQGNFFRWLAFTIAAVSLLVMSGHLLMLVVAWTLTSWGLHHLLLHYPNRPGASQAAWTKFAISRLGDSFLLIAAMLSWQAFGTLNLGDILSQAAGMSADEAALIHHAIAWLLVLGAMTKSALLPFHTWLPETMEAPTPVSALMHAGIINAGGFLLIRLAPLVQLAPEALFTLALIGSLTACLAGMAMMTQSSVKRSLAYSTIAQMGFMMLQCGLGAFSAAMLHLVAHSLYKAHAFLSSGDVLKVAAKTRGGSPWLADVQPLPLTLALTFSLSVAFILPSAIGINLLEKPGGLLLALILGLSLTTWNVRTFATRSVSIGSFSVCVSICLTLLYFGSYLALDTLLGHPVSSLQATTLNRLVESLSAIAFIGLFGIHLAINHQSLAARLAPLRVHAANGFYFQTLYQRVLRSGLKPAR